MSDHELIPGRAQTLSKFACRFPGAYPRSLSRAYGARVVASGWDGRTYLDWIAALGAVSLGYANHAVDDAVLCQVQRGPIFSLPDVELEERVAQRLVDLIPCAESVRFLKDGSCATEAAIRVARAATGRDVILCSGYSSWHSWHAATREEHPGVPFPYELLAQSFPYNDLGALDRIAMNYFLSWPPCDTCSPIRELGIAAVIVEPTLIEPPMPGFLEGLRERADKWGAVLIFDEMVTGFRWHAGGYQALCGVTPDLATFGKGMGNGYPIAALVGRADLMRHARLVSGTFGGDCIGLAAADATLARYQQPPSWIGGECECGQEACGPVRRHDSVTAHMYRIGKSLIDGYNALARTLGAPTRMEGQPPHPVIRWDEDPLLPGGQVGPPNRHRASLFFQETVRRGILFHPEGISIMFAMTDADVAITLAACEAAMVEVMAAIGDGKVRERIEGDPISPEPAWRVTA